MKPFNTSKTFRRCDDKQVRKTSPNFDLPKQNQIKNLLITLHLLEKNCLNSEVHATRK